MDVDWSAIHNTSQTSDKLLTEQFAHELNTTVEKNKSEAITKRLNTALEKYKSIYDDRIGSIRGYKAKIHAKPDVVPVFKKARTIPFALQDAVDSELGKLEQAGIIKSIPFSEWASPIVIVPKPDGSVRICGDFKQTVNPNIEAEGYPTPSNEEIFTKLQGGKTFSKIDLRQAYLQLELDDDSKKMMMLNTNKGLMECQRMTDGMKPASGIFQRMMDNEFKGSPMTAVRTDDVIISGRTDEEHLNNITNALKKLCDLGVTVRKEKCRFFMNEVEHLGHIIDRNGIRVNPNKTEALYNAPIPTNVKELQSFIGGVNYYAKFIPDMAKICKPLYKLLQKDIVWSWQNEQERAFHILKSKLTSAPVLAVYDKKLRIKLDCDASKYGVGAVLSQVNANDEENPIAYAQQK